MKRCRLQSEEIYECTKYYRYSGCGEAAAGWPRFSAAAKIRPTECLGRALLVVLRVLLVVGAEVLEQILVGNQRGFDRVAERPRVRAGIVDGHLDLEMTGGRPAEPLGEMQLGA